MDTTVLTTHLPLENKRTGKVRDLYDCPLPNGEAGLLIIATDRVSAFDVVMANGIPGKGVFLTQLAAFWFELLAPVIGNHHLVTTDVFAVPGLTHEQSLMLEGRIMLCKRYEVIPVECIVRGYLTGTGLKDYQKSGKVCGVPLPDGLVNGSKLPEPIFTPSTKADTGHDENISYEACCDLVGETVMQQLKDKTLTLYRQACVHAESKGIILADTKLEFGLDSDGSPVLIDEIFTPDSSRFWPQKLWNPGAEQESFDKQYVRNYLETLVSSGQWDKKSPGPMLPDAVIANSLSRYQNAFRLLTEKPLPA